MSFSLAEVDSLIATTTEMVVGESTPSQDFSTEVALLGIRSLNKYAKTLEPPTFEKALSTLPGRTVNGLAQTIRHADLTTTALTFRLRHDAQQVIDYTTKLGPAKAV